MVLVKHCWYVFFKKKKKNIKSGLKSVNRLKICLRSLFLGIVQGQ